MFRIGERRLELSLSLGDRVVSPPPNGPAGRASSAALSATPGTQKLWNSGLSFPFLVGGVEDFLDVVATACGRGAAAKPARRRPESLTWLRPTLAGAYILECLLLIGGQDLGELSVDLFLSLRKLLLLFGGQLQLLLHGCRKICPGCGSSNGRNPGGGPPGVPPGGRSGAWADTTVTHRRIPKPWLRRNMSHPLEVDL